MLNERFVVKSFATDIIDWLQNLIIPNEPYLQSAIHQYIDYLQRFFETTNDYKDIKAKIDAAISSHLDIDASMSAEQRVKRLQDQLDSINILKENIERMLNDAMCEAGKTKLRDLLAILKNRYPDFETYDNLNAEPANIGIQVPYSKFSINVHLEVNECGDLYYGVICDPDKFKSKYQRSRKMLIEHFEERHNGVKKEDGSWPIWEYTDINACEDDVTMLIKNILSL